MSIYNTFILADKQDITRAGMHVFITSAAEWPQIVEVGCRQDLANELERCEESVVIIDYTLLDLRSVDEFRILMSRFTRTRWLIFSAELSENFLRQIMSESGVSIVMKENSAEEIRSALRCVMHGESYICPQISEMLATVSENREKVELTPAEIEILKLVASGLSVKEIANKRFSSVHTVITHKKNIFRKLSINNVYEATRYALRAGYIELAEYYI